MIDLSSSAISQADLDYLQKNCMYQPYKLPGPIYTGAGISFCKKTTLRIVTEETDHPDRDRFVLESGNQAAMYDQFIDFADEIVGIKGHSFFDMACNSGFFCYRTSERGATRSVGMDVGDHAHTFEIVNRLLGTNAEFYRGTYDMRRHEIQGVDGEFDIVFNTAFMCHSSDPTFLVEALAKRAKKALLIFSKFMRDDEYLVRYSTTTSHYFGQSYPICFDATTEMSDSLLMFAFKELGFSTVHEVPQKPTWLPRSPSWRAFLAVR